MNMSVAVFPKGDGWTRSMSEADSIKDPWYVEVPGYDVPVSITMEQLLQLKPLGRWRHGSLGFVSKFDLDEVVLLAGHEREVIREVTEDGQD